MKSAASEREFDFTLILKGAPLTDELENALFEAGCDDGTLAIRSGIMVIAFTRTAPSMKDAILSAIRDVKRANVGVEVVRVDDCNLVTQSDIARRMGRSRQLVHQYVTGVRGPGGFPGPVCDLTEGTGLWRWCEVAYWLWENSLIKEQVIRDAQDIEIINTVLDVKFQERSRPELFAEAMEVVGAAVPISHSRK